MNKFKPFKIAIYSLISIAILGILFPSSTKDMLQNNEISKTVDTMRGDFKINNNGETYGTYIETGNGSEINEPDLMAVVGENNVEGYVKKTDFYDKKYNPETLEEVKEYMKLKEKEPYRMVPIYEEDGITVIGEFKIQ
ncbi:MAG: hypothetical protein ACRCX2_16655 [Paraclostridium sp.]